MTFLCLEAGDPTAPSYVRVDRDFTILVAALLHQNQPFTVVISGIIFHGIYISIITKQKVGMANGLIGQLTWRNGDIAACLPCSKRTVRLLSGKMLSGHDPLSML